MQVTDVTRVLASVSKICDSGNQVVFNPAGGFIKNIKTGEKTESGRKGGIYELDVWVKARDNKDQVYNLEEANAASSSTSGFSWQGTKSQEKW